MNNKQELSIGRGHEADVRISDISVSRKHATLRVVDDREIWLVDRDSKFGTLLQITQPLKIEHGRRYHLQGGRSLLVLEIANPPGCCGRLPCMNGGMRQVQGVRYAQH